MPVPTPKAITVERTKYAKLEKAFKAHIEFNNKMFAALKEAQAALTWFVENDDTNIGQEGNEFWEAGLNAGISAIASIEKVLKS